MGHTQHCYTVKVRVNRWTDSTNALLNKGSYTNWRRRHQKAEEKRARRKNSPRLQLHLRRVQKGLPLAHWPTPQSHKMLQQRHGLTRAHKHCLSRLCLPTNHKTNLSTYQSRFVNSVTWKRQVWFCFTVLCQEIKKLHWLNYKSIGGVILKERNWQNV